MTNVPITQAVKPTKNRVKYFEGEKKYLDTGGLSNDGLITETVSYKTKPSRADLLVQTNQIIVARMKNTNKVFLINDDNKNLIVSTGFLVLDIHDGWSPSFLQHYFKSEYFQKQKDKLSTGATQKAINNDNFNKIKIPEISFNEQKRILKYLDQADSLRQKRKQAIDSLDEYLKSVFLEMFGKNAEGSEAWKTVQLKELALKSKGSMRTGPFGSDLLHSEFVDSGVAVIGIDNAVQNKFVWDERRYITPKKYEKLKRYTLYPGDVLVTIMGTTGRSAVIPDDIPLSINSKHLAALTLNKQIANPYFISYSIHSNPEIIRQIERKGRGAIMTGLNLTIIKELEFRLPPIELQNRFVKLISDLESVKKKMYEQSRELDNQFNALIQKHFSTD